MSLLLAPDLMLIRGGLDVLWQIRFDAGLSAAASVCVCVCLCVCTYKFNVRKHGKKAWGKKNPQHLSICVY